MRLFKTDSVILNLDTIAMIRSKNDSYDGDGSVSVYVYLTNGSELYLGTCENYEAYRTWVKGVYGEMFRTFGKEVANCGIIEDAEAESSNDNELWS